MIVRDGTKKVFLLLIFETLGFERGNTTEWEGRMGKYLAPKSWHMDWGLPWQWYGPCSKVCTPWCVTLNCLVQCHSQWILRLFGQQLIAGWEAEGQEFFIPEIWDSNQLKMFCFQFPNTLSNYYPQEGNFHVKGVRMLIGKFELNPKEDWPGCVLSFFYS